jgi:hypothetical protein
MIHPQPTTVLLLLTSPEERPARSPLSTRIAPFPTRRRSRRRKAAVPALEAAAKAAAPRSVTLARHGSAQGPRF